MTSNAVELRKPKDYRSDVKVTWCPGCGDFGVLSALTKAFAELQVEPHNLVTVSGIGCSSRLPVFLSSYGFHTIHGRALPIATAVNIANPDLTVVAVGGDGDGFSIGAGHFVHAARRNPNVCYVVMDNAIYGLTKGQNSPTSPSELESKAQPYERIDDRINPVLLALSLDISFVARSVSTDLQEMTNLIVQGINHPGFALIQIMSPCIEFNEVVTYDTMKEFAKKLPEDHDSSDKLAAMKYALADPTVYTGVFYKNINKLPLVSRINSVYQTANRNTSVQRQYKDILKQFS